MNSPDKTWILWVDYYITYIFECGAIHCYAFVYILYPKHLIDFDDEPKERHRINFKLTNLVYDSQNNLKNWQNHLLIVAMEWFVS